MTSVTADRALLGEVKASMARNDCTRAQLAAHLGIGRGALQRRLSGAVPFRAGEIAAIAALFDVPVATFYGVPTPRPGLDVSAAASG